jgi:hypothetical protein
VRSIFVVGDPWRYAGTTLVVEHAADLEAEEATGSVVEERAHPDNDLFDGRTISFSPRYAGDSLEVLSHGQSVMVNATVRGADGIEKHFIGSATPVEMQRARRMLRHWSTRWAGSGVFVALAWVFGISVWGQPEGGGVYGNVWFWWASVEVLVPAVPSLVAAGLFLASSRTWLHRSGIVAWALGTLAAGYAAQFSHFGGFCIDPGDVCNVTWGSRFAALGTALLSVTCGAVAQWWAQRRKGIA